jgi:sugar phosphate isomerase/epimerase
MNREDVPQAASLLCRRLPVGRPSEDRIPAGLAIPFLILAALSLGFVASAADPTPSLLSLPHPPNPLACRLANYQAFQESAWTNLPAIGVKYVFLNTPAPDQVEPIRHKLEAHHLTAAVLRGDADLSLPTGVDRLATQLETCPRLGVRYLFLSVKRRDVPLDIIYQRLRQAGDIARKHGVTLVIETHPDLGTNGDVQLETMRQVHHPNVRINFDTGNITFYNHNTDAATELAKSIDFVATVELKDHDAQFESWCFPALGHGKVDFPRILKLLRDHHYSGPITIEIEGIKNVTRSQTDVENDIRESVRYLRSLDSFD